ncbi:hypothetical protein COEREDRAFT_51023, partial [Coemansia reversa NRRL 1564]
KTSLIVWDELHMANRAVVKAVEIMLCELCGIDQPFGSKIFVEISNFWQVAPIVPSAMHLQTILESLKASPLCRSFNTMLSSDLIEIEDAPMAKQQAAQALAVLEFLSSINHPGVPRHNLELKAGCIVTLLYNVFISYGLVKNCWLIVQSIMWHLIQVWLTANNDVFLLQCLNILFKLGRYPWRMQCK